MGERPDRGTQPNGRPSSRAVYCELGRNPDDFRHGSQMEHCQRDQGQYPIQCVLAPTRSNRQHTLREAVEDSGQHDAHHAGQGERAAGVGQSKKQVSGDLQRFECSGKDVRRGDAPGKTGWKDRPGVP